MFDSFAFEATLNSAVLRFTDSISASWRAGPGEIRTLNLWPYQKLHPCWRKGRDQVGRGAMIAFLGLVLHVVVSPFKTQAPGGRDHSASASVERAAPMRSFEAEIGGNRPTAPRVALSPQAPTSPPDITHGDD